MMAGGALTLALLCGALGFLIGNIRLPIIEPAGCCRCECRLTEVIIPSKTVSPPFRSRTNPPPTTVLDDTAQNLAKIQDLVPIKVRPVQENIAVPPTSLPPAVERKTTPPPTTTTLPPSRKDPANQQDESVSLVSLTPPPPDGGVEPPAQDWRPIPDHRVYLLKLNSTSAARKRWLLALQHQLTVRKYFQLCCPKAELAVNTTTRTMKIGFNINLPFARGHPAYDGFFLVAYAFLFFIPSTGMLLEFGVAHGT